MLETLMALSLLATPVNAAGGCNCEIGSQEFKVWWCSHKDDKSNCELPDQVECSWAGSECVPSDDGEG